MPTLNEKNFIKAKQIYDIIVNLDKEILDIEKLANELINDDCRLSISINVENLSKKDEKKNKIFGEDMSLLDRFAMSYWDRSGDREKETKADKHVYSFSDTNALNVLGVVIGLKNNERKQLLSQLQKMGVDI